jgi:hypothetical protein
MLERICVAGFLLVAAGSISAASDDIIFPAKAFFDLTPTSRDGMVAFSGTLSGDDLAYKNNQYAVGCYLERKECWIATVEQIGPNQIGRMDAPYFYPIIKVDLKEIVAQEEASPFACRRTTISIARKEQRVAWVEEPVNQTKPECSKEIGKVRRFTIDDSPAWKRMNKR